MGVKNKKQKMTKLLTAVYILILVWLILFKMAMPAEIPYLDHIRNINLIPFYYDNETSGHAAEVIKNVILFIPLGLYLSIMGLKWQRAVAIGNQHYTLDILLFFVSILIRRCDYTSIGVLPPVSANDYIRISPLQV